jgi:uncharacterized protein
MPAYRCDICKTEVQYEGRVPELYPFCSERCRMVDLGLWFREAYHLDRDLVSDDLGEDTPPPAQPGEQADG